MATKDEIYSKMLDKLIELIESENSTMERLLEDIGNELNHPETDDAWCDAVTSAALDAAAALRRLQER